MKKKRYEVTWYKPEEAVLNEEIKDKLVSAMVEEAKALAVRLTCKRINEVEMVCELEAGACLNLNKVLRSLQKKVSKKIGYPFQIIWLKRMDALID